MKVLARARTTEHFSGFRPRGPWSDARIRLFEPGIMRVFNQVLIAAVLSMTVIACAGRAYLPGDPGGAKSDISGLDVREAWVAAHPEVAVEIADAILEGVFVPGMTLEHRDVVTNPKRKGATGNGFWRSRTTGNETRYQWFVSSQREPFVDGRARSVCELVFVGNDLTDVRYCSPSADGGQAG